ncbi:Predicted nucleotide-utilizing enzyme [Sulfurivirga caldicuralii]|uniref:Predicted nucleotide-utilizing enzyme n=1 Tax=Sulfurivirga caldicuralii TaxID=364032 RepID=A0A1N6DDR2_9GAMM|nr:competence/damage-inducible protein A [Sulfurivirga caldicuralii]SIN68922.1 Predicted nucleotide-utilizing enzyme [Sulfurivirga caldicuralii]
MHKPNRKIGLIIIGDEILSGRRQDRHLANLATLLKPRGLKVDWVRIVGDDPALLTETLQETFQRPDIVFCHGGIGATPDDRTRQCAARALGVPLVRHPGAVAEIEAQFGEEAYPHRVEMADLPEGAELIPNPFNRVPGFSLLNLPGGGHHHFMPGFPQMAQPMTAWLLDHYYADLTQPVQVERVVRLLDTSESEWLDFMRAFEQRHPELRLFSLPRIEADGRRSIELGVEGLPAAAETGLREIIAEAVRRGIAHESV